MKLRFFHKLFAFMVAAVLTTGLSIGIVLHRRTQQLLSEEISERGRLVAQGLALNASRAVETGDAFGTLAKLVSNALAQRDVRSIRIFDASGRVLADAGRPNRDSGEPLLEVDVPVRSSGTGLALEQTQQGETVGSVRVFLSTERLRAAERADSLLTALLVLLVTLVMAVPGATFSRLITNRIQRVRDAARRLGAGELAVSLPVEGADELGELSAGFNAMSDQLDATRASLEERVTQLKDALHNLTQAQERLVQSSKMAAVGQLAAGLAHEINNPLSVILGFAQALESRVPAADPLRLPVDSIVRESNRCAAIVKELLTFSRTAKPNTEPLDANDVLRAAALLLESRAKLQGVHLELGATGGALPLVANRTQLQQVLVNLGTNALDAMLEGGVLSLKSTAETGSVRIEVSDTGTGIPPEVQERMFEPFFTTKEVGRGTGLGLSLVHEIVQQHGGSIQVDSAAGRGTTLTVRLPTTAEAPL